jgi:uncharacterized protein YggE
MAASGIVDITKWAISAVAALLVAALFLTPARAQSVEPKSPAEARVVVVGEGSVTVAPDYVRIRSGVSTYAKTVKEASDTNIQTSEFSIEPVYASPSPPGGPKLSGYRVSNQVNVTIHQISQVSEVLDRLVKAGATDAENIAFLISDREKALDQAREAAVANAKHKADLYARASGVNLGRVAWIAEGSDFEPIAPMGVARSKLAQAQSVPIERGENTITARVTVGFDIAQ